MPSKKLLKKLVNKVSKLIFNLYSVFFRIHLGNSCKFHPTCSQYGEDAFEKHGFFRAGFLTFRRLIRCHPFSRGGYDPVPKREIS